MLPMLFGENLFDEFFDNAFAPARRESAYAKAAPNLMKTDVREVGDNFEIDMELPGFKKEQVEIRLENGTLTNAFPIGQSNIVKEDVCSVEVKHGVLLVIEAGMAH